MIIIRLLFIIIKPTTDIIIIVISALVSDFIFYSTRRSSHVKYFILYKYIT